MSLFINLVFDAQAEVAPVSFRTAVQTAAAMLDSAIQTPTTANIITVNIQIGYGELGGTVLDSQTDAVGGPDSGLFESYSSVRADLIASAAPGDPNFNSLPNGSAIQGQSQVAVSSAQLKAFGLLARNANTDDGSIGIGTAIPDASLVGVALHELAHAMGRIAYGGPSGEPDIFDLFRFTSPDARLFSNSIPSTATYFSLDDGNTKLADYGEASDPGDFLNSNLTPEDPFNEFIDANTIQQLTNADMTQMDVLGFSTWHVPPPPAGTTADMILRQNDGNYEIYNIGNNTILAAFALGHVGADWQVAGIGNFSSADQSDMILRNGAGAFEVYDINVNSVSSASSLGQVGTDWQVAGFGAMNSDGSTDMMLRSTHTGDFELYDIKNGQIAGATAIGQVGLEWRVAGLGDFNGSDTTDMILRSNTSGTFEVYDVSKHQLTSAAPLGQVGMEWQAVGFGNFDSDGSTDMMLRNTKTGDFELYGIRNNQITSASKFGQVGLDWQVVGFGPLNGSGMSDMVLRNSTGQLEVYDISGGQLTSAKSLGQVGTDWQVSGFAADSATGSVNNSHAQLVQAMSTFSPGGSCASSPLTGPSQDSSLQLIGSATPFQHTA